MDRKEAASSCICSPNGRPEENSRRHPAYVCFLLQMIQWSTHILLTNSSETSLLKLRCGRQLQPRRSGRTDPCPTLFRIEKRLENEECINAYTAPLVSSRGDVLAISSAATISEPIAGSFRPGDLVLPYGWMSYGNQDLHSVNYTGISCDIGNLTEAIRNSIVIWTISNLVGATQFPSPVLS